MSCFNSQFCKFLLSTYLSQRFMLVYKYVIIVLTFYDFFSRTTEPILTKLGTKHPFKIEIIEKC